MTAEVEVHNGIQLILRKETYSIEEVLSKVGSFLNKKKQDQETFIDYNGDIMKMASDRYKCFFLSGIRCVTCGLEGKFFAKERFHGHKVYHFNLYAINDEGKEILMTKDHILPKSKGGKDVIENYQTMCCICNFAKGNEYEEGKL